MCATVDDKNRHSVHDQHHGRHHKSHTSVYKQVCSGKCGIGLLKTLFLMFLTTERTDYRDTGKDLSGNQIQLVDQSLQDRKFGHCHLEQHKDHKQDQCHCYAKDPCHGCIRIQHTEHTANTKDRRVQNDSKQHGHYLLHLLDIIGTSCDQGSG